MIRGELVTEQPPAHEIVVPKSSQFQNESDDDTGMYEDTEIDVEHEEEVQEEQIHDRTKRGESSSSSMSSKSGNSVDTLSNKKVFNLIFVYFK